MLDVEIWNLAYLSLYGFICVKLSSKEQKI